MSSADAEFVEQPDGALLRKPHRVTRNGRAVRVRPHVHISDTEPAPVSEGKSKEGRVASALYVAYTCVQCLEINKNAGCFGRNILKDSNLEIHLLWNLTRPDFEVSLQSIDFRF